MNIITISGQDVFPHVTDSDQIIVKVVRDTDSDTVTDIRIPDAVFYREGAAKTIAMLNDMIVASRLV